MSKPHYWWWASVRASIKQYPALAKKKAELQAMPVTKAVKSIRGEDGKLRDLYAMPGKGGGNSRTVERCALAELPPQEERIVQAVENALASAELASNGPTRVKLLREYHFRGGLLSSVADRHYVAEATAKRWNAVFVRTVAKELGYL